MPGLSNLPDIEEIEKKIKLATNNKGKHIKKTGKNKSDFLKFKVLERELSVLKKHYEMEYKKLIPLLKKEVHNKPKMVRQGLGGCGGGPYLKASNLPEKGSIEECSIACLKNSECIKYQRSPSGTCYFMSDKSSTRGPSNKDNGWKCMYKLPENKWDNKQDTNYGHGLIKQGRDSDNWIYLDKHNNKEECKTSALKNKKEKNNNFDSVVYFDSNYSTAVFKRECYGQLSGGKTSKKSEKNVVTMIPPNGTTAFGGKKTEHLVNKLERLDLLIENKIKEIDNVVLDLHKGGLYNEKELKKTTKDLDHYIGLINRQRKAVKKALGEHFGKTGEYLQSITNLKMNKYKFYGLFFLSLVVAFVTFKVMKTRGSVKVSKDVANVANVANTSEIKPSVGGAKKMLSRFLK